MRTTLLALAGGTLAALALPGTALASYTAKIQGTTLTIAGDNASDRLALTPNGTTIVLDVGADGTVDFTFDKAAFTDVAVTAGGGDDEVTVMSNAIADKTVTIDGGNGNDTLRGGSGPETLHGGAGNDAVDGNQGNDTVVLGAGNDTVTWDPGDGNETIEGQAGTDALDFNGSNANEIYDLSASGGRVRFTRNVANIVMDLDDVEALNVRALGGTDEAVVHSLTGTDLKGAAFTDAERVVAAGGGGDDAFGVSATGIVTGLGIPLQATTIDGGAGTDTTTFSGTSAADAIHIAANGQATYVEGVDVISERLNVNLLGGDDTFTAVGNIGALTALTVDGGGGNDTLGGSNGADVLIGGAGSDTIDGNQGNDTVLLGAANDAVSWDPGDGSDVIEGQAGTDTLTFNGSATNELFELTADGARTRLTRNVGNIVTDLDDVETLSLTARAGADGVTVGDLTGTDVKTAAFDLGGDDGQADTLSVATTGGTDKVKVTPGQVRGLKPAVDFAGTTPLDTLRIGPLTGDDTVTFGAGVSALITPQLG